MDLLTGHLSTDETDRPHTGKSVYLCANMCVSQCMCLVVRVYLQLAGGGGVA